MLLWPQLRQKLDLFGPLSQICFARLESWNLRPQGRWLRLPVLLTPTSLGGIQSPSWNPHSFRDRPASSPIGLGRDGLRYQCVLHTLARARPLPTTSRSQARLLPFPTLQGQRGVLASNEQPAVRRHHALWRATLVPTKPPDFRALMALDQMHPLPLHE